jgi:riboflavin kinase/FMN adenylyltransferase
MSPRGNVAAVSVSVFRDFADWPAGPLHVALGVFDGVHRGHHALIARLAAGARAEGAAALAITFDPLPIQVLAPGAPPTQLSEVDERAALLLEAGASAVVVLTFDRAFAALSPSEFLDRLAHGGEVRRVVVGPNFRFGHDRAGDVETLRREGERRGFALDIVTPTEQGGRRISSTRIRNTLLEGHVEDAAALLGRPYRIVGRVVHGARRGQALGYPTINLATRPERLLPRDGIYATWVEVDGARHMAASSLGVRPTFGGGARALESYLLDFSGDLYGEDAAVLFVKRIRDELAFESAEALVARIAKDVEETRAALAPPSR